MMYKRRQRGGFLAAVFTAWLVTVPTITFSASVAMGTTGCKTSQENHRICKGVRAWKDGFLLSEKAVAKAKAYREEAEKRSVLIRDYKNVLQMIQDQRDRAMGNARALEKALLKQNNRTNEMAKVAEAYRKAAADKYSLGEVVLSMAGAAGAGIVLYVFVSASMR